MRIDLPGGAWAELRDPDVVTERQRKPLVTAIGRVTKAEGMEDAGFSAIFDAQDATIMVMVEAWSFDAPVVADSLLDLPAKTVDALRTACQPYQKDLMPDFSVDPDPESPSEPSTA